MPFGTIPLNDGTEIPAIAFGTGSVNKRTDITQYVKQALETGFVHLDTAAFYANEYTVGNALRETGTKREKVYITSKFSFGNVRERLQNSLDQIRVDYLDLYLIHQPTLLPDISKTWAEFEDLREEGSIGVSNFEVSHLKELLASASVKPVVNQIDFDLYKWKKNKEILEFAVEHGIVIEGYNSLSPLKNPGGPADEPIARAAKRLGATSTQVTLAWAKSKGVLIVTTSSKKERLQEYLAVGDLPNLTKEEIAAIDEAALKGLPFRLALAGKLRVGWDVLRQQSRSYAALLVLAFLCYAFLYVLYPGACAFRR